MDYFLQVQITRNASSVALRVNWTCKKVSNAKLWLEKVIKRCIKVHFFQLQSTLDISKLWGLLFTSSSYPKCKLICASGNLDLYKNPQCHNMVGERNQNAFLIQSYINASNWAEFEISEFEISRFDYIIDDNYGNVIQISYAQLLKSKNKRAMMALDRSPEKT